MHIQQKYPSVCDSLRKKRPIPSSSALRQSHLPSKNPMTHSRALQLFLFLNLRHPKTRQCFSSRKCFPVVRPFSAPRCLDDHRPLMRKLPEWSDLMYHVSHVTWPATLDGQRRVNDVHSSTSINGKSMVRFIVQRVPGYTLHTCYVLKRPPIGLATFAIAIAIAQTAMYMCRPSTYLRELA